MPARPSRRPLIAAIVTACAFSSHLYRASAADGTWITNVSGFWESTGNWAGGTIANADPFTAAFSTVNITADRTVTLSNSRSIGTLIFGDATTPSNNWILDDSTTSAVLTLSNGASTPVINVVNRTLTIGAVL